MSSEIAAKASFEIIRYAQCWEDADILVKGLDVKEGDVCLSIASAGDNSFAMLVNNPKKVICMDLSQAQLYCVELRVACYKHLSHQEFLELLGSYDSNNRLKIYEKIRPYISKEAQEFWDDKKDMIEKFGAAGTGTFEKYFAIFRDFVLPLTQSSSNLKKVAESMTKAEREEFYDNKWNNFMWRSLIKLFFSKTVMGIMGRDPSFFNYVEGSMYDHISGRIKHAFTNLDPSLNPYFYWILTGKHSKNALPMNLRPENFEIIKKNIDRLEWHKMSFEDVVKKCQSENLKINKFNLSDIFEYMSVDNYRTILNQILSVSDKGARLAYWNMLVPRSRPDDMANKIKKLEDLSKDLFYNDKAFFYCNFHIEEVI